METKSILRAYGHRRMTSQFSVDDEKFAFISREFNVDEKTVRTVYNIFRKVLNDVKYQYLAHIIRSMETYIRKKTNNPMFQINCQPLDLNNSTIFNIGCAQYFRGQYFTIFFDPRMDEKQLRVCLAHELGHLFIVELLNERLETGTKPFTNETNTEPVSSIFGAFTILDKNHFYQEQEKSYNHGTWEDIIRDFVMLDSKFSHA